MSRRWPKKAYLDEQYQRARWRDSLRFELCSLVFRNPEDVESFHKCAEALGIDPTVPRIALAMRPAVPAQTGQTHDEHRLLS